MVHELDIQSLKSVFFLFLRVSIGKTYIAIQNVCYYKKYLLIFLTGSQMMVRATDNKIDQMFYAKIVLHQNTF